MTAGRVYLDFETRSEADLGEVGVWPYSQHPSTDIICLCWRIRHPGKERSEGSIIAPAGVAQEKLARLRVIIDDPSKSQDAERARETAAKEHATITRRGVARVPHWTPKSHPINCPGDLRAAIDAGYEVEAHNYSFELAIWENVAQRKYGWPAIKPEQWRDTMATACYYAMPAKLDSLLGVLGLPRKHPGGARLITKYSKLYLKTSSREIPPDAMADWLQYCSEDVLREEQVSDYLGDLPEREEEVFLMDQDINLRGIKLDLAGIAKATEVVEKRAAELVDNFRTITGLNPTQNVKVMEWCAERGVKLDNMQKDYLTDLLEEDGDIGQGEVRDALTIRLRVAKASTSKLAAMARNTGADGRARWQQRYHGAQTGRQTGSGFQPLNLVRGWEDVPPDQLVRDIMYGDPKWLDCLYGDATEAVSKASRHWIMAEEGYQIYAGDFVSIEAVILACLAGEDWKIEAFRNKEPMYERMGDKIHGLPVGTVTKKTHPMERQDGKTGELAFGYEGGLNAWLKFDSSGRHTDDAIEEIKEAWRDAHPMVAGTKSEHGGREGGLWKGLGLACLEAVTVPGKTTGYRDIGFQVVDEWLSMILPNGKRIWYREPKIEVHMPQWHKPETKPECADRSCKCKSRPAVTYWAQKTGQWSKVSTYGGKLAENACQAVSREFLIPSMKNARKHKLPIILSVYDEIVCELKTGSLTKDAFETILLDAPGRKWAEQWPIRVDAWIGSRYKK